MDMKIIRSPFASRINISVHQARLNLPNQFQWRTSWGNIPLELPWLFIDCVKLFRNICLTFHQLSFSPFCCFCGFGYFPKHKTESECTWTFASAHLITCGWDISTFAHDGSLLSMTFTPRIPSELSDTNLWVMLKKFLISSTYTFMNIRLFPA